MFHMTLEEKNLFIKKIQDYFLIERDEVLGIIAAESILAFFLDSLGKEIYNRTLEDSKKWMSKRMDELFYDFDELYK